MAQTWFKNVSKIAKNASKIAQISQTWFKNDSKSALKQHKNGPKTFNKSAL